MEELLVRKGKDILHSKDIKDTLVECKGQQGMELCLDMCFIKEA